MKNMLLILLSNIKSLLVCVLFNNRYLKSHVSMLDLSDFAVTNSITGGLKATHLLKSLEY